MYQNVRKENSALTPKRAEELLRLNTFEGQRPISTERVRQLEQIMRDGAWRYADIAVARKSFNGGEQVIVNGQHQLSAIVAFGAPVRAVVDYYDCEQADDLWKLFGTYDVQRVRTEQHIMKSARGLFASEAMRTVPLRVLHLCGTSLLYLGGGTKPNFAAKAFNKGRKAELVQQYESDVMLINSYFCTETEDFFTIPVATAIIATHRLAPRLAKDFWDRVLTGIGLVRNSPQHKLHQKLATTTNLAIVGKSNGVDRHLAIFNLCACWWNAWRTGDERHTVKLAAMKRVVELSK